MHLGIDASNLSSGGALTHLSELLKAAEPEGHGIERVFVWGGRDILGHLPGREWLESVHEPVLDGPLPVRALWQQTKLARLVKKAACDLLFVPGGTYLGEFRPYVTMSRNMLPFDFSQVRRYGVSAQVLRLMLLRLSQSKTLRRADGTIFLNDYARARVVGKVSKLKGPDAVIPHGVSGSFRAAPKRQKPLGAYSKSEPFTRRASRSDCSTSRRSRRTSTSGASPRPSRNWPTRASPSPSTSSATRTRLP